MAETFLELRQEERERRRELILDAAEKVFGSKGFQNVSIRDIAREAGISAGTIYHYFKDKHDLFVEAFIRGAKELLVSIEELASQGKTVEDIGKVFVRFLLEKDHYFKMMSNFMLEGNLEGESLKRLNAMTKRLLDVFEKFFEGYGKASRLASHAFFASLNGILITFRNYPGRSPEEVRNHMERLVNFFSELFLESIRSRKA